MFKFMVLSTNIDSACFQMFRAISGTVPTAAGNTMEVPT